MKNDDGVKEKKQHTAGNPVCQPLRCALMVRVGWGQCWDIAPQQPLPCS